MTKRKAVKPRSAKHRTAVAEPDERFGRFCIGCGCCDTIACEGGCGWLIVDGLVNVGVCTECPAYRSVLPMLKPEQLRRLYREKVAKAREWA